MKISGKIIKVLEKILQTKKRRKNMELKGEKDRIILNKKIKPNMIHRIYFTQQQAADEISACIY